MFNFFKNIFTKTIDNLAPQDYKGIAKAEKALDKGRTINMTNAKSKRYTYGDDEGYTQEELNKLGISSPGAENNIKKSGRSGLYTAKQMHEAGFDISVEDRSPDIQEKNIDSTCIQSFKYNPKNKVAEVRFRANPEKEYSYPDISEADAKYMLRAPSKGKYYWKSIQPHSQPDFRGKA